jgi:AraC family transcriptional regulator
MWASSENQLGEGYSPLRSSGGSEYALPSHRLASSTISASEITQERDGPAAGQWYSDRTYFFNLSLTGRPPSARGRFDALQGEFGPVGDLFFIPAGQRYLARGGPGRQRTLFVEMAADDRLSEDLALSTTGSPVLRTCMNLPFDRLRELLLRVGKEVRNPGFASALLLEGLGITLLAETLRMLRQVEDNAIRKGGLAPWRMRTIETRIRDSVEAPSLAELADLCGLSRRQLMRAFKEETGQTIGAYAQEMALERAKNLLRETDLPVAEVASRVGFATATSFATAFRRSIGGTPRAFRASRGRH